MYAIDVQTHLCNQQVGGSSPSTSSNPFSKQRTEYGGIPEWPKGADCKSVVSDFDGSNPPSPTKIRAEKCGFLLYPNFLKKNRDCRRGDFRCRLPWIFSAFSCWSPHVRVAAVRPAVLHTVTLTPTLTPTAMGRNVSGWTK